MSKSSNNGETTVPFSLEKDYKSESKADSIILFDFPIIKFYTNIL